LTSHDTDINRGRSLRLLVLTIRVLPKSALLDTILFNGSTRTNDRGGHPRLRADVLADITAEPQIVAAKDGEQAFFVVRTGLHPGRGRFDEGQESFDTLVRHAMAHGASCYFASVGIANSQGATDEEMSVPVKGVAYNVVFDGLVRMTLPEAKNTI
jgi:hypothetical protein